MALLCQQGDLEEELHATVGDDDFFEYETQERLALGEGHILEPGGDFLAKVADPAFQIRSCGAMALFECDNPFQLGHPVCQGTLAAFQVVQGDGAGLVGVEEAALLSTQPGELAAGT